MLILGHAGITLGTAALLNMLSSGSYPPIVTQYDMKEHVEGSAEVRSQRFVSASKGSRLVSLAKQIDVRLLLIGSLFPDIIDKPVGLYIFRDTFSSGRIFCHTLLFLVLITIAGVYLDRRHTRIWLLVLSFGTLTHLILDQMWLVPRTFLWPLYGLHFEPENVSEWGRGLLHVLRTDPGTYVPEIIGAVILAWFIWTLVRNNEVYAFIKNGRVL